MGNQDSMQTLIENKKACAEKCEEIENSFLSGSDIAGAMDWEGRWYAILNYLPTNEIEDEKLRQLFIRFRELDTEITVRLKELFPEEEEWF